MRRTLAASSAALAIAGGAAAATAHDQLIRPGAGIGKVSLGMTAAQVRRALGKPWTVVTDEGAFGRRELTLTYRLMDVRLAGRKGSERVVWVSTRLARERTASNVGPGVLETVLMARERGVACDPLHVFEGAYTFIGGSRMCSLATAGGGRTMFLSGGPWLRLNGPGSVTRDEFDRLWARQARVSEVIVRAPGVKHPYELPRPR